jgi:hypothetical protein
MANDLWTSTADAVGRMLAILGKSHKSLAMQVHSHKSLAECWRGRRRFDIAIAANWSKIRPKLARFCCGCDLVWPTIYGSICGCDFIGWRF